MGWKIKKKKKKLIGSDFLGSPLHLSVLIVWTDDLLLGLCPSNVPRCAGGGGGGGVLVLLAMCSGSTRKRMERAYFLALLPFAVCCRGVVFYPLVL